MTSTQAEIDAFVAAENARVASIIETGKARLADIRANPKKYRDQRIARNRGELADLASAILHTLSLPGDPMSGESGLAVCDAALLVFQDSILEVRQEIEDDFFDDQPVECAA